MLKESKNEMSSLKWEIKRRLEFIETSLFWDGRVNRRDLMKEFGISGVQATSDLSRYTKLAAHNLSYSHSDKSYIVGEDFQPIFKRPHPEDFLSRLRQGVDEDLPPYRVSADTLNLPTRKIDIYVLREVVYAIREKACLEIQYQSMSKPDPKWRLFAPHSFAFDGMRWHVRAFCYVDNMFKDFLLARILGIGKKRPSAMFVDDDLVWKSFVDVLIAPHPGLSPGQRRVIEDDYCMTNGVARIPVRQALLPYLLQRLNLIQEREHPEEQQVVLNNKEEILGLGLI